MCWRTSCGLICIVIAGWSYLPAVASTSHGGRVWLTELFTRARNTFALDGHDVSIRCRNDFRVYASHLTNQTVWAVRMLESSDWPRIGILAGITTHLGNWAECMRVSGAGVTGQYCLVETKFNYTVRRDEPKRLSERQQPMDDALAWEVMQKIETDPIRASRLKLSWALCVPSSCSVNDVKTSLETTLVPLFREHHLRVSIALQTDSCSRPSEEVSFPRTFHCVALGICMLTIIVASISTYYAFATSKRCGENCAILEGFSVFYNLARLNRSNLPARYNMIYFVKVFGITLVIGGHILLVETQSVMFQTEEMEMLFDPYQHFSALDSCVDIFSVISGFLMFHFHFEAVKQGGFVFVMRKVALQWTKLSAMTSLYVLYATNVWPYLSDGPLWKRRIFAEAEKCRQNWWTNILGIANLFPAEHMCLLHTWYLSVNIQLYALGGILLYTFANAEWLGMVMSTTIFLICTAWTGISVYSNEYNAVLLGYIRTLSNLDREKDFELYVATFARVGPYILGFISAYVASKLRQKNVVLSKWSIIFTLTLTTAVAVQVGCYRTRFNIKGRQYDVLENVVYASLCRPFLVLPFAYFLCAYFTSLGYEKSVFNTFLEHHVWLPFGRLVPNAYLIHYILLLSVAMSRRTYSPVRTELDVFWQWAAALFYSFEMAFFWFLFVESPLMNTVKLVYAKLINSEHTDSMQVIVHDNNEVPSKMS